MRSVVCEGWEGSLWSFIFYCRWDLLSIHLSLLLMVTLTQSSSPHSPLAKELTRVMFVWLVILSVHLHSSLFSSLLILPLYSHPVGDSHSTLSSISVPVFSFTASHLGPIFPTIVDTYFVLREHWDLTSYLQFQLALRLVTRLFSSSAMTSHQKVTIVGSGNWSVDAIFILFVCYKYKWSNNMIYDAYVIVTVDVVVIFNLW